MDEEPEVKPRRPFCMDCLGAGKVHRERAALSREPDGRAELGSAIVPVRCPNCRGTGRAGIG